MNGLESYKACKRNALKETLDGNTLLIIGYNDLIKNKMAVDRETDKSDIIHLEKKKGSSLED